VRKTVFLFAFLVLLAFSRQADAAGFGIYEWSARGNALGGAMVARADDPSAVAFNPAGMVQLEGTQMMFGFTAISPTADMTGFDLPSYLMSEPFASTVSSTWFPPHFYYSRQISDRQWFGIGLFTRFGLGTEFDPNWFGRYNSYKAEIMSVSLNPSWAWKINEKFSVGLGVEAMYFGIDLKKKIPNPYAQNPFDPGVAFDSELEGDSFGWGWNMGLLYKVSDTLKFALTYRSQVDQEVEGDFDLYLPDGSKLTHKGASGQITLPDLLVAGVALKPTEKLSVEMDAVLTRWSTYDRLTINFDDHTSATSPKNWSDTWRYQLGIEYALNENLDLRLGYVIDPSPIPDETVDYIAPTNDRKLYSIGLGYQKGAWTYDFSYTYLDISPRNIQARPEEFIYESRQDNEDAHLFGFSISRKF
jgi:long-chain fatty acid transport protein